MKIVIKNSDYNTPVYLGEEDIFFSKLHKATFFEDVTSANAKVSELMERFGLKKFTLVTVK